MKVGSFAAKIRAKTDSLENSEYLTALLVTLFGKRDTPDLIAYLADGRDRLLLCKALVSPVSAADRRLEERANKILRFRGMDPDELKKRLEPAAFALGLVSSCDVQVDYYDVLGVKPAASSSQIRAAYRKKAFEVHPDTGRRNSNDEIDFVTVKAAYDTLNNPNSRAAFDQCRIALDAWYEEDPKEFSDKKPGKRPSGKTRKAFYRVAAVMMAMVVMAWVISILYEAETMVEVVEVPSFTESSGKMAISGDKAVKTLLAASEAVKEAGPEKPVPKESEQGKSSAEMKAAEEKTIVAALAPPVGAEKAEKPTPKLENTLSGKPEAVPVAEPEAPKSSPAITAKKKAPEPVKESPGEAPKELAQPAKKEKAAQKAQVAEKQQPKSPVPVRPKSFEKAVQLTVKKESIPADLGMVPEMGPPSTDDVKPEKTPYNVPAAVQAKAAPAASEKPAQPAPSVHLVTNLPAKVFPDVPIPKAHKTPFVEHAQVVDFLKAYTSAYEKGNAQVFFSFFTDNALENGKPLKDLKPDYLKIWGNVQHLDYRIAVDETKQVVGSEWVSMKGRFKLNWKFFDGQEGQSHGNISMKLKVNDDVLKVSRLDYRFDG